MAPEDQRPEDFSERERKISYSIRIVNKTNGGSPWIFIETRLPFGNESVIFPKMGYLQSIPRQTDRKDKFEYIPSEDHQQIPVFADYSASPSTDVHTWVWLRGSNSWKQDYDKGLGNSYSDTFEWYHTRRIPWLAERYGSSREWRRGLPEL